MEIVTHHDLVRQFTRPSLLEVTAGNIWSVMTNPQFMKSTAKEVADTARDYVDQIRQQVEGGGPIKFVIILFPFKMRLNPLKTDRYTADLGEVAVVSQLMAFDREVRARYLPGTHWTVLTEGEAYGDLLHTPRDEIVAYRRSIERVIEMMGAQNLITLGSLHDTVNSFGDFPARFDECLRAITDVWPMDTDVPAEFASFFSTFFASQDVLHIDLPTLRRIYGQGNGRNPANDLSPGEREIVADLRRKASADTRWYMAYNKAKNLVGARGSIQDTYPEHLYVSITSKPGRWAIHPTGPRARLFPHHGVPVLRPDGNVVISWLDGIRLKRERFAEVYIEGDSEDRPFYYRELSQ